MDILFLCHRIPYPPDKGDKIRSFSFLRYLARRHHVELVAAADDPDDLRHIPCLKAHAEALEIIPFGRAGARVRAALALATGRPLSVAWFPVHRIAAAARRLAARRRPDLVFAFSSQMAPAAFALGAPVLLDLVDRDSAKWRQYRTRARGWRGRLYGLEARRLARAEERWVDRAAAALVISPHEQSMFPPALASRLEVVGNPIEAERFPADRSAEQPDTILFAGALDYLPNTDAVLFFARDVMPRIRAARPAARFLVAGPRAPASLRRAVEGRDGTRLLGYVPDLVPVYARAAVSVAPFRFTQGVLNKVTEALVSGIPVVATPEAVQGLGLQPGQGVVLGRGAEDLGAQVIGLLADPKRRRALGAAGRRLMLERSAWPGDLPKLDAIVEAVAASRAAGAKVG